MEGVYFIGNRKPVPAKKRFPGRPDECVMFRSCACPQRKTVCLKAKTEQSGGDRMEKDMNLKEEQLNQVSVGTEQ